MEGAAQASFPAPPEAVSAPRSGKLILLKAVWDMIDDMVNLEIFEYPMTSRPTNLVFKSGTHKRVFAILLADFLAQPRPSALPFAFAPSTAGARETDRTYLFYLDAIGRQPTLGADASGLAASASAFPHQQGQLLEGEGGREPSSRIAGGMVRGLQGADDLARARVHDLDGAEEAVGVGPAPSIGQAGVAQEQRQRRLDGIVARK